MAIPSYTGNPYNFFTPCAEMDGSPTESASMENFRAVVTMRCAWEDRYSLANEVSDQSIYQRAPDSGARARTVTIEPLTRTLGADDVSLGNLYEEPKITSEYVGDKRTPQEADGALFSEELQPTAEHLTLPGKNFVWASSQKRLTDDEAPGILVRGLDYVLTHYGVTTIPAAALTLVGCVNNATVNAYFLGLSFPAETLLFNPPTTTRRVILKPTPQLKWTLVYRFTYKPNGWNKFWDPNKTGGPGFDTIRLRTAPAGADVKYYPLAAFTGL